MPKKMKRALLLLVVASMLLASLCGCTGGTESSTEDSSTSAQSGEPSVGGSVTVGITQDLDSLDPHRALSAGTSEVLFNIFEGLVKVSPDGGVIPAVAGDYEISDDKKIYTFELREGVKFHNGDAVTMEDVIYSLERCAGSENEGTPLISAFSNIEQITAEGDSTLVITLAEPSMEFLFSMTAAIIPADSGDEMATAPVGTGPFKYVSYTPQESMVVEKFEEYWGTSAYLDKVTFKIFKSVETMVMSLKSHALDMAIHLPNTLAGQIEDNFTVYQDTMKLVQALYLNNNVEPLNDVRVRQAIYYAVDVDEIIDFVCDGAGVATGTSMYPAYTKYFLPELTETYQQDLDKAKQLLKDAGYADGFELTITVPGNYEQHVQTAEVIEQQLAPIGIKVTIDTVEWEAWVSDVYRGRNYMSTVCGISASDMTAREMLIRYMSEHQKNFINFNNSEYDETVNKALAALDDAEQTEFYKEAERILNKEAASIWIQDLCDLVVTAPELGGITFYRTYVLDMSTIYFNK